MSRRRVIAAALVAGVGAATIGYWGVACWLRRGREAPSEPAAAAAADAPASAAPKAQTTPPELRTLTVTIYQRAPEEDLKLIGVPGPVVWFDAPVDRARQVVQLVLEGVPGQTGAIPPAPPGVRFRDVYIAANGRAWVDLDGASLVHLGGSDVEMALVGALARSLVEALDEVREVGVLIDGQARVSLGGHVDLTRTYTGREWSVVGGAAESPAAPAPQVGPEAAPEEEAAPPSAEAAPR